ncbi:MAG: ATP-binding cassette domain-containing protein [Myxococcales bacterium FL481]|nr:MAG: ATP-binding cassette domain-containing protein [Myxococcales bacterium FL481]
MTAVSPPDDATPTPPEPLLEMRGVVKAFGSNVVYRDMDLAVRPGETLTVLGGSGTGKSVCLKLMIGLLYADEGRVLFKGEDVGEMDAEALTHLRRQVAMVFQGGALFDSMTVEQNVVFGLREHTTMGQVQMRDRAVECLTMVGLGLDFDPEILDKMPASLSGGMRKRVALARSIALKPEVILYDEPTTGLDPPNCDRIANMIRKLQTELGVTSVVVTHDIQTAWHVSDRVAMLLDRRFPYVDDVAAFRVSEIPEVRNFTQRRVD